MVEVVAGRPIEAERCQFLARRIAQQRDRKAPADMRGVEQRAIGAVVDVEFVAAALFDPHDQRAVLGGQRATGLAPQFGRIADRQAFEAAVDRVEIGIERGGSMPG